MLITTFSSLELSNFTPEKILLKTFKRELASCFLKGQTGQELKTSDRKPVRSSRSDHFFFAGRQSQLTLSDV